MPIEFAQIHNIMRQNLSERCLLEGCAFCESSFGPHGILLPGEAEYLSAVLDKEEHEFTTELDTKYGKLKTLLPTCCFYKDRRCAITEHRPLLCRTMPVYPIWENGKLTFKISRHCPLVCRGALPENFIKAAKAAWSAVKLPRWWQDAYSLVIREELPKDFNRTVDFALLGLCWDKTQSFRSGSAASPKLLRNMFVYIEPFFGDVDIEKQVTLEDLGDIEPASYEELLAQTAARLKTEKIPLLLGGEHSITLAGVRAIKPKVIVSLDAHPDVYTHPYIDEVWIKHKRSEIGHDCVMRHIAEDGYKIIFYGTRARSADEAAWMKGRGIRPATLEDLRAIKEPVYLSIDFDVLDPSIIPIVGNPEPDGLSFGQVIQAVRALARNIIAVDFVELTPLGSSADKIYIHLAAKLIYAVMAEIVRAQGRG